MLKGTNIQLRALEPDDVELLYRWENDPAVWLLSGSLAPFSKFVLEQYLAGAHQDIYTIKELRLVIELINDEEKKNKAIGCIDLFDYDPKNRRAGVGILIGDTSERNKGYASEAIQVLTHYAFTVLDIHQLYCNILQENKISMYLFQRQGFEIAGIKKSWIYDNGKWHNECLLQLIRKN